jgi:hypothetical protein
MHTILIQFIIIIICGNSIVNSKDVNYLPDSKFILINAILLNK